MADESFIFKSFQTINYQKNIWKLTNKELSNVLFLNGDLSEKDAVILKDNDKNNSKNTFVFKSQF